MGNKTIIVATFLLTGMALLASPPSPRGKAKPLAIVDVHSRDSILDEIVSGSDLKDIDGSLKAVIRSAVSMFWDRYLEENAFQYTESELSSSRFTVKVLLDSIDANNSAAEAKKEQLKEMTAVAEMKKTELGSSQSVREEVSGLQHELDEINVQQLALLSRKKSLTASLAQENASLDSLKAVAKELEAGKTEISRFALSRLDALEKSVTALRNAPLKSFDKNGYATVSAQYKALHPLLGHIDEKADQSLSDDLSYLSNMQEANDIITDAYSYFEGKYDDACRGELYHDLSSLKGASSLRSSHLQEYSTCVDAIKDQPLMFEKTKELFSKLLGKGYIATAQDFSYCTTLIEDFKNVVEASSSWHLYGSMVTSLKELNQLFSLEAKGRIPDKLYSPSEYRSQIRSIWATISNEELTATK